MKLQQKRDVIYELDAALWVDALRSYLTLLQRAGLVSFKRREKPYKVWPAGDSYTHRAAGKEEERDRNTIYKESVW